jgi:hypothetical protein
MVCVPALHLRFQSFQPHQIKGWQWQTPQRHREYNVSVYSQNSGMLGNPRLLGAPARGLILQMILRGKELHIYVWCHNCVALALKGVPGAMIESSTNCFFLPGDELSERT